MPFSISDSASGMHLAPGSRVRVFLMTQNALNLSPPISACSRWLPRTVYLDGTLEEGGQIRVDDDEEAFLPLWGTGYNHFTGVIDAWNGGFSILQDLTVPDSETSSLQALTHPLAVIPAVVGVTAWEALEDELDNHETLLRAYKFTQGSYGAQLKRWQLGQTPSPRFPAPFGGDVTLSEDVTGQLTRAVKTTPHKVNEVLRRVGKVRKMVLGLECLQQVLKPTRQSTEDVTGAWKNFIDRLWIAA